MLRLSTLILMLSLALTSFAQQPEYVTGNVLIQMKDGATPDMILNDLTAANSQLQSLKIERCIGEYMNVWLLSFDNPFYDAKLAAREIGQHPRVQVAQVNHIVQDRATEPNDPDFDEQWYHVQGADHDIDTDLAWDITTGGYTQFGDRIVVCVIEGGGADWDHEDLIENHWVNEYEIAGNNIDDDGNGYVDDFDGWNPPDDDDDIPSGNHGTAVSSMIGARGDNNLGIAGVNWDVGIMQVTVGGLSEANVMEAYAYPLTMRQIYNETGGEEGAFVVATNASWGIDNGDPDDAPLWCAYYDTLGEAGILNCGATANNNVNIDVVGDLPTACPSPYMVSCTATNNQDVRTFSAYGIEHVDLGAPGESVYLCENGDDYGNTSGTSFASPCVAGVIALMYSVPCPSMMALVQADPQEGANYILQTLFDGVDEIANLSDEVATGGRVNAYTSCQMILDQCSDTECLIPFSINVEATLGDNYEVTWEATSSMLSFDVRHRVVGAPTWMQLNDLSDMSFPLINLPWCSEYEVQILAHCDEDDSNWSASYVFETDGCCIVPLVEGIMMTESTESSLDFEWDDILAAVTFTAEISPAGANDWAAITGLDDASVSFEGLEICAEYDIRVMSVCDGEESVWTDALTFTTAGCIDCTSLVYCEITGDGGAEWISLVNLNTISNATESDDGYGDYTNVTTELVGGQTYSIYLEPGFADFEWTEFFNAWIDFNGDQVFDESELIFASDSPTNVGVGGDFTVPIGMTSQPVTMRVSMDWMSANGGGDQPVECGELGFGEAEDYCIILDMSNSVDEMVVSGEQWKIFPNPTTNQVTLAIAQSETVSQIVVTSASGQKIYSTTTVATNTQLDLSSFEDGLYFATIIDVHGNQSTKPILLQR